MPTMLRDWWDAVSRIRRRLRYLWAEMDPDGVELLSAALSATFAVLLVYRRPGTTVLEHALWYALLSALGATMKVIGVALEIKWLRLAGLGVGVVFWTTLAYVLLRATTNSVAWLCFAVLALAQLWAARQVWKWGR